MELFGLHDKDGKEYKFINRYGSACWDAIPITPEPKFKVGDWVIGRESIWTGPHRISDEFDLLGYTDEYDNRIATKEEIETHLKSIADEKYFNKTALCLEHGDHRRVLNKYTTYDKDVDELVTLGSVDGHTCNVWLYRKGKWAEIIPEKKKLPKTKDELVKTLKEYFGAFNIERHPNYEEFLDQYED